MGTYSEILNARISTRGPKEGYCTICREFGSLSKDHVPPQGCGNTKDVEVSHLLSYIQSLLKQDAQKSSRMSQGGLHYKSICKKCNSHLLGTMYDPELIKLCRILIKQLIERRKEVRWSGRLEAVIHPHLIAKSVIGHLLASNSLEFVKSSDPHPSEMDVMLASYFLDPLAHLPEKLEVYCWIYPYTDTRIIRSHAKMAIGASAIHGHIIKFFPLGFWFVWDKPEDVDLNLDLVTPLFSKERGDVHNETILSLGCQRLIGQNMPEMPGENELVLMSNDMTSVARRR